MKKLVLIYCLFTVSIFSQWVPQTSGTIEKLNDAIFQNQTTGYVCGNSGVILKTTDGGTNWIAKPSNTSHDLKCIMINPVNNDYVLAVGNVSTLLLSTNAGATFSNVAVSPVDWNKVRHADIFNVYGILLISLPITLCFLVGLLHFEKLEKQSGDYRMFLKNPNMT